MCTSFVMVYDKDCKHSYRYKPDNMEEAGTNTFYLLKAQCNGAVPKSILVTVTGLE